MDRTVASPASPPCPRAPGKRRQRHAPLSSP